MAQPINQQQPQTNQPQQPIGLDVNATRGCHRIPPIRGREPPYHIGYGTRALWQ